MGLFGKSEQKEDTKKECKDYTVKINCGKNEDDWIIHNEGTNKKKAIETYNKLVAQLKNPKAKHLELEGFLLFKKKVECIYVKKDC